MKSFTEYLMEASSVADLTQTLREHEKILSDLQSKLSKAKTPAEKEAIEKRLAAKKEMIAEYKKEIASRR